MNDCIVKADSTLWCGRPARGNCLATMNSVIAAGERIASRSLSPPRKCDDAKDLRHVEFSPAYRQLQRVKIHPAWAMKLK